VRKSSVRIDERARHLNMDVCSDAMLAEFVTFLSSVARSLAYIDVTRRAQRYLACLSVCLAVSHTLAPSEH